MATSPNSEGPAEKRAIVCDDDPVVRRIVTAVLQRCGYGPVEQTGFASEAIDLAEAMQPQVVILDLTLEEESGLDAIPELRSVAPGSRIVVYSASEAMKGPARRAGADAVLDKVSITSVDELERVVSNVPTA